MAKRKGNSIEIIVQEDNMAKLRQVLDDLDRYSLDVGIFASDDSFYSMIANVHEFGLTIKAKDKMLTIPTKEAEGRKAADIPGLFRPKGKDILAVSEGGNLKVMFILKKSVTIPERSFVRSAYDDKNKEWLKFFESQLEKALESKITVKTMFERLGAKIQGDIQQQLKDVRSPANSPITEENKGSSNPLIDTGGLRQRITYKVVG
ncbi:hypothetical protein [Mycobacteroides abscessus]|uniref:hypothetical protein n=1 Tax=Mycobacteroides abscessus TaxID=36809 RepID=UPI0018E4AB54